MADTIIISETTEKNYVLSGQFASTTKTSIQRDVGGGVYHGTSWDGIDSFHTIVTPADKAFRTSGQFTNTVKDSLPTVLFVPSGISADEDNTPITTTAGGSKLRLFSGKFSTTVKDSETVTSIDALSSGISRDKFNTPWVGKSDDRYYLQSGQFTSTLKTSLAALLDAGVPNGISYTGADTLACSGNVTEGDDSDLVLSSGQFSTAIKSSLNSAFPTLQDIETTDFLGRLGAGGGGGGGGPGSPPGKRRRRSSFGIYKRCS